jgi:hypothetical protein
MAEMPEAVALPDRSIRLGIAGGEEPFVVGGAKALGLVGPIAVVKRAESSANSPRLVGRNSGAQQPQVMAMAIAPRLGVSEALRRLAH